MICKQFLQAMIAILLLLTSCALNGQDPVNLSVTLLQQIKGQENTEDTKASIAKLTVEQLQNDLDSDAKKLAFWINIYNGYIIDILSRNPELYEDRRSFFKEPYIDILGRKLSFADIEHGIIRRSAIELLLGYATNPLAPSYEKKLRVDNRDFRIHFALNCGAKSCPPVAIYKSETLDQQLNDMTKRYLHETTTYDPEADRADVVALFSWFRGDFGGGEGIRDILVRYGATPDRPDKVITKVYDWTLDLDNWR